MAADVEKLLVQIRADLKDLKQLQVELANVRKQGQDAASSISAAFGNVAKVFGALKLKGVFDSAVSDARNLEKTILGLQATARLTGNNFQELNTQVKDLAKDGVLSIDRASQSMKVLLAQGLSANKAFELVDAAKKVGAFNNIVGDTGQAVQDFIKFLQTGSAELAENLDPSLVKVVKSLGGYEKVANDATAKQKLINAVIQKGKDLTQDYAKFLDSGAQAQVNFDNATTKLSQTFGEKLAPAYNALQNGLARIINLITDLISGFDSTSVSIVAATALILVSLQGIGGGLGLVSASAATAWEAILGPLALIVAALGAVALAVNALYDAFKKSESTKLLEEKKALEEQIKALEGNTAKVKELSAAKERLNEVNKQITEQYGKWLKFLEAENLNIEQKIKLLDDLERAQKRIEKGKKLSEKTIEELKADSKSLEAEYAVGARKLALGEITAEQYNEGLRTLNAEKAVIDEELASRLDKGRPKTSTPTASKGAKFVEVRYTELETELKKSLSDFEKTVDLINAREAAALTKLANPERLKGESVKAYESRVAAFRESDEFKTKRDFIEAEAGMQRSAAATQQNENFDAAISKIRQSQAEFLERETTAKLQALQDAYNAEIGNVFRLAVAEQMSKEEVEKKLQVLRETNARKAAKIYGDSFTATLESAAKIAEGIGKIRQGDFSGAGQALSGLSGLGNRLTDLGIISENGAASKLLGSAGVVGSAASSFFSVATTIGSFFTKSDAERRAEAEKQRQRDEEAKVLLTLQANYQKSMLAIQESNARLPFENLNRNLRLIDIKAQQARVGGADEAKTEEQRQIERRAAFQSVLQQESGTISGGSLFAGVDATPEGLTAFLNQRAAQSAAVTALSGIANSVTNILGQTLDGAVPYLDAVISQIQSLSGQVPQELISAVLPNITELRDRFRQIRDQGYGYATVNSINSERIGLPLLGALTSEISRDTGTAENLLGVLSSQLDAQLDIQKSSKKTAENTSKLEALDPRKISFIDLVRNSIFSRGINVDYGNLQLPTSVSSTVLASTVSPVVPSDTLAAMREMVSLMDEANDYLAVIAKNTNKSSTDDTDISDNRLVTRLNSIRSRSVS